MALNITGNNIEIIIPNSEASIKAQHVGIKDRTVGSFYVSEYDDLVQNYLNNYNGEFYIDMFKTYMNMNVLYDCIIKMNLSNLFKDNLMNQLLICSELEKDNQYVGYYKVDSPILSETRKYLKFNKNNKYMSYFLDMLLGDLTKIVFVKNNNSFVIYGDVVENYQEKLIRQFK